MFEQLSPNLFLFRDTCNVYIIREGSSAVLIDFGSGDVLRELASLGITQVSDVLMTHHHRDQGQGLNRAVEIGARIWVPETERALFADVDAHWQSRPIYNNYDVRQDRFSLLASVSIAGTLNDYTIRRFGTRDFSVIPTPGHTVGSITLITWIDRLRIAFTGDLIAAPGKIWSMAATQWTYNGGEGISSTVLSLLDIKERAPARLLPSHGDPMTDPPGAIDQLVDRLNLLRMARNQNPRLYTFREHPYQEILPHLLQNLSSVANSYVLLSNSHKALFIDFGYDFVTWPLPAGTDRSSRRPWLYTLPMLKRDFGVEKIDVVIPTHHHDDHVAGMNMLREVEGTQVWAAESFARVLEHPEAYNLPCLWYDPILVDRQLPLGEPFTWEEYTLTLYPLPGHTQYAVAIAFEVDNTRVLATGDQYTDENGAQYNYVYENHFQLGDYRLSAELYARLNPDLIISGHNKPLAIRPGFFDMLRERGDILEQWHRDLLMLDTFDLGGSDFAARIEPYQIDILDNAPFTIDVIVRNPHPKIEMINVTLVTPAGWKVKPHERAALVTAHAETRLSFLLTVPPGTVVHRERIAADVSVGNQHLGQHAEALITVSASASLEKSFVPDLTHPYAKV